MFFIARLKIDLHHQGSDLLREMGSLNVGIETVGGDGGLCGGEFSVHGLTQETFV